MDQTECNCVFCDTKKQEEKRDLRIKQEVIRLLERASREANDSYFRANQKFGRMSEEELHSKYGHSDQTPADILKEYADNKELLQDCLKWIEDLTR